MCDNLCGITHVHSEYDDDEYAKYSPDHSRHYGIAGKLHDVCEECHKMINMADANRIASPAQCETHSIAPLTLSLDEWQTLRNATFWHSQNASTPEEKERIDKIRIWLNTAIDCISVDTIRLEAVR